MSIQTKGKTPSKAKKWLIPAVALLLLGAIVFAIVWSSIDHSYRYDKEDLSSFFDATLLDKDALAAAVKAHKLAAIMIEPVQGEGGVCPLDKDYVTYLASLAAQNDILVIADEVQTGNGRTGTLYAYMQYGFTPDILSTAKGLAGGLPLGATLLGEKVKDTLTPSSHGSTFGGNPVCCAGALHVLSRLDEPFLQSVREKADYTRRTLGACNGIYDLSGLGLMIGFRTKKDTNAVITACRERGVLVIKAKDKVRLLPPLNIEQDVLARALDVIVAVCSEDEV